MEKLFAVMLSLAFFSSCGTDRQSGQPAPLEARLEIVDSVQVDLMVSYPNLMDIRDKTGEMLVLQNSTPVAYLLSPDGKILKKMDRPGDDPEAVGNEILAAEFFEDGIALMGFRVIKTYDTDFNLRKTFKVPYGSGGMMFSGYNHLQEATVDGEKHLTAFYGAQTDFPSHTPQYYENFNVMDLVHTGTGEFIPLGKLQPDSRFLNGRAHYFLKPEFHTVDSVLYYAFTNDTILHTMDLRTPEIIQTTSIPFDEFILFNGYTMGPPSIEEQSVPSDIRGSVSKVFHINGLDIITYTSGIKLHKLKELRDPGLGRAEYSQRLDRVNYKKYLILKNGKRLNTTIKLPEKLLSVEVASSDGFLWATQNVDILEEEPDIVTFYKLQVVME